MALQAVHDKIEDIPKQYRDLYTEKSGEYELTRIVGVNTGGRGQCSNSSS